MESRKSRKSRNQENQENQGYPSLEQHIMIQRTHNDQASLKILIEKKKHMLKRKRLMEL